MKKKRWKKLLAWVITCCMLIGMAPDIQAATPETSDTLEETYDYHYPYGTTKARPEEDFWIHKFFDCYVRNSDHPDGEDIPVEITDVEITEGEDVVSLQQTEDDWNLRTEQCGTAKVKITYNPVEGSSDNGTYTFDVFVDNQVCRMNVYSDTGTNNLLPGESQTVTVEAWLDCYDEERYHYREDNVKDNISIGHIFYDENAKDLISVEEIESSTSEDGETIYKTYKVTAREDAETGRGTNVTFLCCWLDENGEIQKDEEGNNCTAEECEYWLNINDSYYNLEPLNLNDGPVAIGESITVTPRLMFYQRGTGPQEITDDLNYRWEYDPNVIEIKDSEDTIVNDDFVSASPSYTITKLSNDNTNITLIADLPDEDGNHNEVTRRDWWLDGIYYDLYFEDLREGNSTYVFTNEASMELRLNTDSLGDLPEYTIDWMIGKWDENGEFTELNDVNGNLYRETEDKNVILIDGTKIPTENSPITEWGGFDVRVLVKTGENVLAEHSIWTGIRDPYYDYQYPCGTLKFLPDWNHWIDRSFNLFMEDPEHPYGENMMIPIESFTVVNADDAEGDDPVVSLEENEDGWNIHANRYGHAIATIHYDPVDGTNDSGVYSFDIYVDSQVAGMNVFSDTGTDNLLPGESQTVTVEAWLDLYNEEGMYGYPANNVKDRISIGHICYDENAKDLISVEEIESRTSEDGETIYKTYKITAKEDAETGRGTNVTFLCCWLDENGEIQKDEEGNNCTAEECEYWLNINDSYYNLEPLNLNDGPVAIGESITVTPRLMFYQRGTDPQEITEDLNYRWEYDPEVVELKDSNGNIVDSGCVTDASSYTITKCSNSSAKITLIADRPDENGIYNEVTRREYYLYYTEQEPHTFNVTSLINGGEPDDEKDYISGTQVTLSVDTNLTCECNDTDITYEWYKVDGETKTKVENETNTLVVTMGDTEEEYICNVIHNENEQSVSFILKPHIHTIESHKGKAATCTEAGWKAYETCKNCDYTTYEEIPATGNHKWDNGKVTGGKKVYTCTACGETKEEALPVVKVSKITVTGLSHNIAAGKKVKLTTSLLPKNAANKKIVWSSSNKKVATVSQSGLVTVLKKTDGKSVVITAAAADGSGKKATFKITSKKGMVTKVSISGKKTLSVGKSMKLKATVKATAGAYKTVKWTSSNTKYATVSSKGVVKALKAGKGKTVTITAMALDGSGKKATFKIKI